MPQYICSSCNTSIIYLQFLNIFYADPEKEERGQETQMNMPGCQADPWNACDINFRWNVKLFEEHGKGCIWLN